MLGVLMIFVLPAINQSKNSIEQTRYKDGGRKVLKKRKFLIGGIIILLAIAGLSSLAFKGAATYYYTVSEVIVQESTLGNQNIRVAGQVAPGSIIRDNSAGNTLNFILIDSNNNQSHLSVTYKGAVPDTFKEGNDAVIEGRLSSSSIFEAKQIIVKCPSKYEPEAKK
jgi:cytochrome c-type biogenesis protein CcmE